VDKSLLDTDILSEIHKAHDKALVAKATEYRELFACYTFSSITVMETVRGLHAAKKLAKLAQFLASLSGEEVLPFTRSTAELAGKIDADLQATGLPIGRADPMIAATAIEHHLVLVTGNTNHFSRIQTLGYPLQLDNWRSGSPATQTP
jgi:tRNA(fMet)-specific endonuclease VapC